MTEQFKSVKKKAKSILIEVEEGIDDFNKNMEFGLLCLNCRKTCGADANAAEEDRRSRQASKS